MTSVELVSALRCPLCSHVEQLVMPTDACQFFHECSHCHTLLRPHAGDCCVFCSFGSIPCPPIQEARATGTASSCCAPIASSDALPSC